MSERYLHLHFDAGLQHMDGETALRYARSRQGTNGEGSDFARAKRQQKVIMAAREKALGLTLFESLTKISDLVSTFGETVQSNVELNEMGLFYKLAKDFDPVNVKTYVLDTADPESGLLYNPPLEQFGGAWILLPLGDNWDEVQDFTNRIFYTERAPLDNSNSELPLSDDIVDQN